MNGALFYRHCQPYQVKIRGKITWNLTRYHSVMLERARAEQRPYARARSARVQHYDEGATPLHLARDREIDMLLLRHGADPEIKDYDGKKCPMRI